MRCLLWLSCIVLLQTPAIAGTIHVPADQLTVQAGIDAAVHGDTILVAPGSYVENINFKNKAIVVHASAGPEFTALTPASPNNPTVTVPYPALSGGALSGFTIQNGGLATTVTIDCPSFTLTNNVFRNNIPQVVNPLTVVRVTQRCNITRNVFYGNKGINCIYASANDCRIINNTFDHNARGIYSHNGLATVLNNVFTNTAEYTIFGGFSEKDYNLVWPGGDISVTGPHGLIVYPDYVDSALGDYRLRITSPCINAGHPDPLYLDPDGTPNDIGAFPFATPTSLPVAAAIRFEGQHPTHVVDHTPTIQWTYFDTTGSQAAYDLELDDDNNWLDNNLWKTGEVLSDSSSVVYAGPELLDGHPYFLRIRVSNGSHWGDWTEQSFRMNSLPTTPTPLFPAESGLASPYSFSPGCLSDATDPENDLIHYYCVVYLDPGLANPIDTLGPVDPDSAFTQFPAADTLVNDKYYYWVPLAFDGYEFSPPSTVMSFTTHTAPASLPVPSMYADIQGAIDNAAFSDTILVSPGTYHVRLDFRAKDVTLKSAAGCNSTFLEPIGTGYTIVTMGQSSARLGTLDGFTIRNSHNATAVVCRSGSIRNCDISYNHSRTDNGGITAVSRYALIENCRLHHNTAEGIGGALELDGDAVARNCEFYENVAEKGAAIRIDIGRIEQCIIRDHTGSDSTHGAIYLDTWAGSMALITNNTIVRNYVGISGSGFYKCRLTANIFAYNELWDAYTQYGSAFGMYNCLWQNGPPGDGVSNYYGLSRDPLFVDTSADDFHLLPWSPCVDAGGPDTLGPDPDGTRPDIGALPVIHRLPTVSWVNFGDEDPWHVVDPNPTFYWSFIDTTGASQIAFELEIDTIPGNDPFTLLRTGPIVSADTSFPCSPAYLTLSPGTTYCYRIRVDNGTGFGGWHYGWLHANEPPPPPTMICPVTDWVVNINGPRLLLDSVYQPGADSLFYDFEVYDDPDDDSALITVKKWWRRWINLAEGFPLLQPNRQYWWRARVYDSHEYSAWTGFERFLTRDTGIALRVPSQFPNVQAAMDHASADDTVLVSPGTYTGDGNRDLRYRWLRIHLVSTNGPAQTIFDLQGTTTEPHNAAAGENYRDGGLVQGFTFRNGYRVEGGAFFCYQTDRFSFRNCIFASNGSTDGGAIFGCGRRVDFLDSKFLNNWSSYMGGAISSTSSSVIVNCEFLNNHAEYGGALYRADYANIRDCLFRGNSASLGSAMKDGGGTVYRSVFNRNTGGPLISICCGSVNISHSTIVDNSTTVVTLDEAHGALRNCIVAFNAGSAMGCSYYIPEFQSPSYPYIENSCIFGNQYGFIGCIGQFADTLGNFSLNPMFCDTAANDFRLNDASPCATAAPDGTRIGAVGVGCVPVGVDDEDESIPRTFSLEQNYPNPFNPSTSIRYSLAHTSRVQLIVYNILGQHVSTLVDAVQPPGPHEVIWHGIDAHRRQVASGIYLYRLSAADFIFTRKMLLLK